MKKLFTDGLKQIGIPFTDPQGAYFVLADIGPYMRKGESDVDFCLEMAKKVGVACVPGTSFSMKMSITSFASTLPRKMRRSTRHLSACPI